MTPAPWPLTRGRVYAAKLGELDEKYYLVVSNNARNRNLGQVLAVRLTTSSKPQLDSIVPLTKDDNFTGFVVCDDIIEIYPDEVRRDLGALSARTLGAVNRGLKAALAIPD